MTAADDRRKRASERLAARVSARLAARDEAIREALGNEALRTVELADRLEGSPGCDVWTLRTFALPDMQRRGLVGFDRQALGWRRTPDDPAMGPWSLERVQAELGWRAGC